MFFSQSLSVVRPSKQQFTFTEELQSAAQEGDESHKHRKANGLISGRDEVMRGTVQTKHSESFAFFCRPDTGKLNQTHEDTQQETAADYTLGL